jgi:prolyl-tRNA synthetase
MLDVYVDFCHRYLAMPVISGEKTPSERFPGAVDTYTIEAMTQDRKALQAGTSHFLGQNFSKSCGIEFQTVDGNKEYGWTTSWGVTTRLIGGLIMAHSDDDGLVLPPRIAPTHLIIIPIIHDEANRSKILDYCESLSRAVKHQRYGNDSIKVFIDKRDLRGGEKSWGWIKKGAPLRLEVGLREIEEGKLSLFRRDKPHKERISLSAKELEEKIVSILDEMQSHLLKKATQFREEHTLIIDKLSDFHEFFAGKGEEIHGGFALCHWNGDPAIEAKVKEEHGVTIRCIPRGMPSEEGRCLFTGEKSPRRVIFAKAY